MPLSSDFEETEGEIELNLIKCDPSLNNDGFIGSPRPTMLSTNINKINKFSDLFIGNNLFEFIAMEINRYYRQNYGRNKSHKKMRKGSMTMSHNRPRQILTFIHFSNNTNPLHLRIFSLGELATREDFDYIKQGFTGIFK
ncbi:piggyBac transposable element-derived protein 4 isoform X1 [Vespula maculifrons]|uniref:PiggyBac transposable element-derived protein 4 isoform X1 n=1 Tax=Vespula maculifrons TaxID=7453 RepID=A0ABD2ASJ4_VESMC